MISKYKIDMCSGPLFSKIVLFAIPMILTGILQLLFNAADLMVLGQFASHNAMAAVGVTGSLTNLIVGVFIGLSIGTNVLAATYYGAKDNDGLSRTVHTSMAVSIICGILVCAITLLVVKPILIAMGTPEELLAMACRYTWICAIGFPALVIYNFGSAILRSVGDTQRPLYYLFAGGVINVILNLILVLCFKLDVEGVAIATVISQFISAYLIVRALCHEQDACRFEWQKMRIDRKLLRQMMLIGLPAGLQGACFSLSNVIIQSSINSFGALCIAGNTSAASVEGIVYVSSYCMHQTAISFVGQNLGGKQYRRIRQSICQCCLIGAILMAISGWGCYIFGEPILELFSSNKEANYWGIERMRIIFTTYSICAIMDVVSGGLRGLGHSILAAVTTLGGVCLFRILWVYFVFPINHSFTLLMISYPVTWIIPAAINGAFLIYFCHKLPKENLTNGPIV
jgi:putative MATE family efflux protein